MTIPQIIHQLDRSRKAAKVRFARRVVDRTMSLPDLTARLAALDLALSALALAAHVLDSES